MESWSPACVSTGVHGDLRLCVGWEGEGAAGADLGLCMEACNFSLMGGKGFCCPKVGRKTKVGRGRREKERERKKPSSSTNAFCWDFCPEMEAQRSQRAHLFSHSWALDLDRDLFSSVACVLFSPGPTLGGVLSLESAALWSGSPGATSAPAFPSDLVLLPESAQNTSHLLQSLSSESRLSGSHLTNDRGPCTALETTPTHHHCGGGTWESMF